MALFVASTEKFPTAECLLVGVGLPYFEVFRGECLIDEILSGYID